MQDTTRHNGNRNCEHAQGVNECLSDTIRDVMSTDLARALSVEFVDYELVVPSNTSLLHGLLPVP